MPPDAPGDRGQVRLTELLAALSLVTDLARGRPAEEAMRSCLLATALARSMGLSDAEASDVYFTTLLRSVGCTATSHDYAAAFGGDDVAVRRRGDLIDAAKPVEALSMVWSLSHASTPIGRLGVFAATAARARQASTDGARADCEVGARMARRFRLGARVEAALLQVFERWDGKGSPSGLEGEAIAVSARIAAVASAVIVFEASAGPGSAIEAVGRWSGRLLDPAIVETFIRDSGDLFRLAAPEDPWVAVVAAEPGSPRIASGAQLDEIARGFADLVDLKSPYLYGHSAGVADLAERAAMGLGLADSQVVTIRRAGLLHDLGRVGIPTGIWEKPGPLTIAEWEQVRLHPYHSERILSRAPALAPLARLAGLHHERLDGGGYHRGAPAVMQDFPARILAAADVFQALIESRPHRPAFQAPEAARILETEALDLDAVRAVIEAAGERSTARRTSPAGLTARELEVLQLLVRGRSEREIAKGLVISPSTVHTHVVHIYEKAGVSTRAGLAMFAMERDLIRRA